MRPSWQIKIPPAATVIPPAPLSRRIVARRCIRIQKSVTDATGSLTLDRRLSDGRQAPRPGGADLEDCAVAAGIEDAIDESPRRPLTARQLAALIGVSQSAVSRAFTPGSSISDDLRQRIRHSAREFGYQPNAIASMLTTRRTNIVGIVVSSMRNPFYPVLIESLTQGLQKVGLQSLLFNITPGANIEEQLFAIRSYNVDAVVVIGATVLSDKDLAWATKGRKSVILNRRTTEDTTTICCDETAGVRAVVDHFHALGRKRIGYVAGLSKTGVGMERHTAFVTRLAELGLRLAGTAGYNDYSYPAGWRGALDLMPGRPDAIFFASDILALGGSDALRREGGVRIPEDIAVAGFDDIAMAAWPSYALTTYRQPIQRLVDETVTRIVAPGESGGRHVAIPGDLVIRASTTGRAAPGP
jgi:DNA-binding LacI/PurR family transcriptional regulator